MRVLLDTHIILWALHQHKDPFDCIMIAQAKAEDMIFVTHDSLLSYYMEKCIVSV